jgi:hypothetical protein
MVQAMMHEFGIQQSGVVTFRISNDVMTGKTCEQLMPEISQCSSRKWQ